ncbi:unnamed protein product [Ophioblennius macclurei]
MKLCLLLLGCCLCGSGLTDPTQMPPQASTAPQKELSSCAEAFAPEDQRAIGGAVEQLGLSLLEKLAVSPQQPNVIVSPLSVAVALAQLTLGARNETEQQLLQSLHAQDLPCYHHVLGRLLPHFSQSSLQVAARMYLRPGFEVKLPFVEESLARYQSRPVPLLSVEEVNQWVENTTSGHITNFLESAPHDIVLMLINAVYFKGEWQTQFDPQGTSKAPFYVDKQDSVSVDMMKSAQYPLRLLDHPELQSQVASFPFKGNTSFLVVLPRGNISSVLPKVNISDIYERLPQEKNMQVNLPKVKLQYRQELQEALSSMGLSSLYSGPDLSGVSDEPLRVTGVHHASTVELSEEGVEASASTAVTSMRSVSVFAVNSPFFFALVDDASLMPLFMGVVTNPAPDYEPLLSDDPHGNATMSDQPATDTAEERNTLNELRSETGSVGGGAQSCSAPSGDEQLQNEQDDPYVPA